jgi:DNA polymerase-3 subunit gamma/tau
VFAPARDRYKIFILDEAHMITQQGFNALLKIVEEPPEHVKFIFATTEPEKVIGTIRSRTHHYPFRLVPPAELLSYIEGLCTSEGVEVEQGVLPLVVRSGGGSVRDTLSVLDQLIAGSTDKTVTYDRAVGLLGYTHGELLAEVISAVAAGDGPGSFVALDKVIHTGQDPRRFAEDLLDYVRDLIIVDAAGSAAADLLPGSGAASREVMQKISQSLGSARLSQIADAMSKALGSMTGATSPKLHLELLIARLLVVAPGAHPAVMSTQVASAPAATPTPAEPTPVAEVTPADEPEAKTPQPPAEPLTLARMETSWTAIVEAIAEKKRTVWTAMVGTEIMGLVDDVVTIGFPSLTSADVLKKSQGSGLPANAEVVREAIMAVTGHRVRFKAQELPTAALTNPVEDAPSLAASWPTVSPPHAEQAVESEEFAPEVAEEPEEPAPTTASQSQIGEAVIREVLGGQLISEHPVTNSDER